MSVNSTPYEGRQSQNIQILPNPERTASGLRLPHRNESANVKTAEFTGNRDGNLGTAGRHCPILRKLTVLADRTGP